MQQAHLASGDSRLQANANEEGKQRGYPTIPDHVRCCAAFWLLTSQIASSAPKNHEELQEQLGIIILDEAAIGDATQKLPKSLQALLQKLVQSSTMPLSKLVRRCACAICLSGDTNLL